MAEVTDLLGGEGVLVGSQFQPCVSEALEDLTEAVKMFLPRSGEDYDIVQIKEARFQWRPASGDPAAVAAGWVTGGSRAKRFGGGWWRRRVGDGDDLQSAHILSGM